MRRARQEMGWLRRNVLPLFPERQVILRTHGQLRYLVLSTGRQLRWATIALAAVLAGLATLWADHMQDLRAERARQAVAQENGALRERLGEMRRTYVKAFQRLDEFDRTFSEVLGEVDRIEASMAALIGDADDETIMPSPAVLAPVAVACPRTSRDKIAELQSAMLKPAPPRELPTTAQVEAGLERLRATHRRFLDYYIHIANERVAEIDKALSAVGLSARTFLGDGHDRQAAYAVGGPFIPMGAGVWDGGYTNMLAALDVEMDRWSTLGNVIRSLPFGSPIEDGWISSRYGARTDPINGLRGFHKGLDFGGPWRAPIRATGDGTVEKAGKDGGYGNVVEIDHGMGIRTRYAHLACVLVKEGQKIRRNTIIGLMGATGRTKGAHLHYEVRVAGKPRDPNVFLSAGKNVLKR